MGKTIRVGGLLVNVNEEHEKILRARQAFVQQFCRERGWSIDRLSMEQILEIRAQEGWKSAGPMSVLCVPLPGADKGDS